MDVDRCARHPQYPTDNCPRCAPRIDRAEDRGLWDLDEDSHVDEVRYERHVTGDE